MRQFDPSTDSLALREQAARQDTAPAPEPEPQAEPSGQEPVLDAGAPAQEPAQDTPAEPEGGNHAG